MRISKEKLKALIAQVVVNPTTIRSQTMMHTKSFDKLKILINKVYKDINMITVIQCRLMTKHLLIKISLIFRKFA